MKKVMLVFGTRPEAIKMCPLVKEFQKHPNEFETIVCVTGQHREMLDQVLTIFDVKPDYDLNIMKQGQDFYDVTARVLTGMRDVFKECKPDVVLVHGDTTTSTAAALAAFYQQIPVGHVEAGLNSKTTPNSQQSKRTFSERRSSTRSAAGRRQSPSRSTTLWTRGLSTGSTRLPTPASRSA